MRFLILLIFPLLVLNSPVYPQEEHSPFGLLTEMEYNIKECEFEKGADAMILLDYTDFECDQVFGGDIKFTIIRWVRIKIFNRNSFSHADIKIPYVNRQNRTKITDISAVIYNKDDQGKIISQKIEKDQIFRDNSEEIIRQISFTFPGVREGSVIEYRYTRTERKTIHIDPWFIQSKLPVLKSQCNISVPDKFRFEYYRLTDLDVQEKENKRGGTYRINYSAKRIPSFNPEPYMGSLKDNLHRIEFNLQPTSGALDKIKIDAISQWKFINRLMIDFPFLGMQTRLPVENSSYILDSVKSFDNPEARISFIYHHIKNKMKWDEEQTFYAENINESWKAGKGNSAEMNLLLLNLLKKAGVPSFPLLISTRDNGKINTNRVSLSQFNGVVVLAIDTAANKNYVLDATVPHGSYKIPPFNILNRSAFLLNDHEGQWIFIEDNRPLMNHFFSATTLLDSNLTIQGDAYTSYTDYAKDIYIRDKKKKEDEDEDEFEKTIIPIAFSDVTEENEEDEQLPLIQKFKFSYEPEKAGDYILFNPSILTAFRKNPFTAETRQTEIDFGCNQRFAMTITLDIPGHMTFEEFPKNIRLLSEDTSLFFSRFIGRQDNKVICRLNIEIRRAVFEKEEYPAIRDFYKKMFDYLKEQIIVKPKNM